MSLEPLLGQMSLLNSESSITDPAGDVGRSGGMRVWLMQDDVQSLGVCWTPDTSECPSVDDGCTRSSLSEVLLQIGPDELYWLSPKACAGVLRRAAKRGRELPEELEAALRSVMDQE